MGIQASGVLECLSNDFCFSSILQYSIIFGQDYDNCFAKLCLTPDQSHGITGQTINNHDELEMD